MLGDFSIHGPYNYNIWYSLQMEIQIGEIYIFVLMV